MIDIPAWVCLLIACSFVLIGLIRIVSIGLIYQFRLKVTLAYFPWWNYLFITFTSRSLFVLPLKPLWLTFSPRLLFFTPTIKSFFSACPFLSFVFALTHRVSHRIICPLATDTLTSSTPPQRESSQFSCLFTHESFTLLSDTFSCSPHPAPSNSSRTLSNVFSQPKSLLLQSSHERFTSSFLFAAHNFISVSLSHLNYLHGTLYFSK